MSETVHSLQRRLAELEENLRLIRVRRSEYVLQVDIPLQLIKEEQRLEGEIEDLQAQLAQAEPEQTTPVEPLDTAPSAPPKKPPAKISRRAWWLLVLLVLDLCLIILWGWCLIGDQPNLMAYLQTAFTIVGALVTTLALIFVMRHPVALEDVLLRLDTNQWCAYVILGSSSLVVVVTLLLWPLGWVGKCVPTPTPTVPATPPSTSTASPTSNSPAPTATAIPIPAPTPTPTIMPTPAPDCRGAQVSYLELGLATGTGQKKYPDVNGVVVLTTDEANDLVNLSGRATLTGTNIEICTCYWEGQTNVTDRWEPITSVARDCSFSIELPTGVTTIYLKLTISGQTTLFTVRIYER